MRDKDPKPSPSGDPASNAQAPADSPLAQDPAAQADPAAAAAVRSGPASKSDVQAYIGRQLRAVYDDVASQPVPDRFLDLMKQLEAKAVER